MPRPLRYPTVLLALLLFPAGAAAAQRTTPVPPLYPGGGAQPAAAGPRADTLGLRMEIGEVGQTGPARTPVPPSGPLSRAAADALLVRLPGLPPAAAADSFAFPAQTLPAPRSGRTVAVSFPPRDSLPPGVPVAPAAGLVVTRRAPEGEVPLGAEVTVTFSRPMIPLSAVGRADATPVPVRLTPAAAGRWRWLDPRTARFEPEGRLPMATEFQVEVPAGTRAHDGSPLGEAVRWRFATPPARATGGWPHSGTTGLQPVILVAFDGRVPAGGVIETMEVRANGRPVPIRAATAAEVQGDEEARLRVRALEAGRWVAVRPREPLPGGAHVEVRVGPGTPSAEGPRRTEDVQTWSFRTYGPLRVTRSYCGWREATCRPGMPMVVELSNPLAPTQPPGVVRVEPALEGMQVHFSGERVMVRGRARPFTEYTVTLGTGLADRFGQRLAAPVQRRFRMGPAVAQLVSRHAEMVVLDPLGPPVVSVRVSDHPRVRVRVHRVRPEDWGVLGSLRVQRQREGSVRLPGSVAIDRVETLPLTPGEGRDLAIDLAPALDGGVGQLLVAVEALEGVTEAERRQAAYFWVQGTRLGLVTAAEADSLSVWAASLVDGRPLAEVDLSLGGRGRARTGATGLATIPLAHGDDGGVLVARSGADVALLGPRMGRSGWASWERRPRVRESLWHVFTDRHLYRPGETVRFKGWVRHREGSERGRLLPPGGDSVAYRVVDARGNEIAAGGLPLGPLAGFHGSFQVPEGANLGTGTIELTLPRAAPDEEGEDHEFEVQEFRRPEYEVSLTAEPGPYLVGTAADLTARAAYFAGGGLPGAAVDWDVSAGPGHYVPPGWEAWAFGIQRVWWRWWDPHPSEGTSVELQGETDASGAHAVRLRFHEARPPRAFQVAAHVTITDVNRQTWTTLTSLLVHPAAVYAGVRTNRAWLQAGDTLELDLVAVDLDGRPVPGRPLDVRARRFEWRSADGAWSRVEVGEERCTRVSLAAPVRCDFPGIAGGDWEVAVTTQDDLGRRSRTELRLWAAGPGVRMPFREEPARRTVDLIPDRDRYHPGDTARVMLRLPFAPARGVLSLRRDGVIHTEPFTAAEPTHTLRVPIGEEHLRNVHLQVEVVGATDGGDGDLPTARGVDAATGTASLDVSVASRGLTVLAVPVDTAMSPDAPGAVDVEVRDAAGRPAAGVEIALVGVDEAVLALTGYQWEDPLLTFYPERPAGTVDVRLHPLVEVAMPDLRPAPGTLVGRVLNAASGEAIGGARIAIEGDSLAVVADPHGRFRLRGVRTGQIVLRVEMAGYEPALYPVQVGAEPHPPLRLYLHSAESAQIRIRGANAIDGFMAERAAVNIEALTVMPSAAPPAPPAPPPAPKAGPDASPISLRTDFDPLAFWVPAGRTDANGRLRAQFTLPSNLTRYRVTAVAVGEDRFGLGAGAITARRPLMARPSAPRFLNFGDRFELPVVVQNGTGQGIAVQVAARGTGIAFTEPGRTVTVPAFDRAEVRIPAEAVRAGPARVQVVIAGGGFADAAELTIPVYTPATAEAFAVYGQLTGGAAVLPLDVPEDAIPAFGGLEVTASSTALQELTDAFLYLVRYPFECAEQKASRILAVAALRDVLAALHAEGLPSPEEIEGSMRADVRDLAALQNPDGGWGFWTGESESWPYVSIHVAHALQRARDAGFAPPEETWSRALGYLRGVPGNVPADYPAEVRRALHAYSLYTRGRMGDHVAGDVAGFLRRHGIDGIRLEEAGWLLAAADAAGRAELLRLINNRATETPSTATFATRYTEGEYLLLHSDRRTDAIVLEGLLAVEPQNELVTKTVRGLLGHRVRGRWESTQENAWVLLALNRYFREYEAQTPDFVARVWLGERYAGGAEFRGRSGDRAEVRVPMAVLQERDPESVTIGHEGVGRLYFRAGLRYAPRDLDLTPLQRGFAVERTYEPVDDPADVARGEDGVWRVRAGARVRVTVTMTAPSRRIHVALVDPLPAGWEPINPELRGSQPGPPAGARGLPGLAASRAPWRWQWFEHQNLRDDRVEAFTTLLPAGVHTYSYTARATTPGIYIVPPPRAEEMYSPETFGRGATERVIVQ